MPWGWLNMFFCSMLWCATDRARKYSGKAALTLGNNFKKASLSRLVDRYFSNGYSIERA
jgi:hypothetical protein